jgi:hypothetical protein
MTGQFDNGTIWVRDLAPTAAAITTTRTSAP